MRLRRPLCGKASPYRSPQLINRGFAPEKRRSRKVLDPGGSGEAEPAEPHRTAWRQSRSL